MTEKHILYLSLFIVQYICFFLLNPYTVYDIVYYRMPCLPMSMLPIPKTPTHVCTHMYITHSDTDRNTICIIHGVQTLFTGSCMCRNGDGSRKRGCCDHSIQGSWLDVYEGRVPPWNSGGIDRQKSLSHGQCFQSAKLHGLKTSLV